jgi:hypothetical protein
MILMRYGHPMPRNSHIMACLHRHKIIASHCALGKIWEHNMSKMVMKHDETAFFNACSMHFSEVKTLVQCLDPVCPAHPSSWCIAIRFLPGSAGENEAWKPVFTWLVVEPTPLKNMYNQISNRFQLLSIAHIVMYTGWSYSHTLCINHLWSPGQNKLNFQLVMLLLYISIAVTLPI